MAKTVVLGPCDALGSVVVERVANRDTFSEILMGDINAAKAEQPVSDCGSKVAFVPLWSPIEKKRLVHIFKPPI